MAKGVVVLVDDEIDLLEAMADVLWLADFVAVHFETPERALLWLSSNRCDALVTDLLFNGHMSGYMFADYVWQHYHVPALIVTGLASNDPRALLKPFDVVEFVRRVGALVAGNAKHP